MHTTNTSKTTQELQANTLTEEKGRLEKLQAKTRKGLIAALIGLSLSWGVSSCEDKSRATPDKLKENEVPSFLVGKKATDFFSMYLGGEAKGTIILWETYEWDKNKGIANMYQKKFSLPNKKELTVAEDHYRGVVSKIDFNKYTPITLSEHKKQVGSTLNELKEHIDREKLWDKLLWGNKEKLVTLQALSDNISAETLTSYSMTELLPSDAGNYNKNFLNFLLQNAGTQYIENIPAMYDSYASFWRYQFTSKAVYDTGKKKEGASRVNEFVKKSSKIPWSVCLLKGQDHHKAAYLFIMYNLSNLLRNWDSTIQNALKELTKPENQSNLAQLVAIMHNKPANWSTFLKERYKLNNEKEYLQKKTRKDNYDYDLNKNGAIDLYESFVWWEWWLKESHNYGKKTSSNFQALSKEN